jgi:hypothetical protein
MATPENRGDLRNKIRARLGSWADDTGALSASSISASVTSLTLAAALDISEKALLQIDDEVIRVKTYTAAGTSVASVMRGDRGSTAATHSASATVNVYPFWGWTDFDINREIDCAIDWLWPDVWVLKALTNTLLIDNTDFGLPSGTIYPNGEVVKRVELLDTNVDPNEYREILGWKHVGDRLIFSKPTTKTYTARIWVMGKHARLTSDSAQLTNADPVEAIVYYAASNLLEQLLANRVRYVEYSASLNDRASTPDELQRQAYYFKNQAVVARDRISRPPLSGLASTRRTG